VNVVTHLTYKHRTYTVYAVCFVHMREIQQKLKLPPCSATKANKRHLGMAPSLALYGDE
jgi:hypothetical protein